HAAISSGAGEALTLALEDSPAKAALAAALSDPHLPKAVHDYKDALRTLGARGIELAGIKHDPSLYSYLLNPTYSNHSLDEVALRTLNHKLSVDLAERADLTGRLSALLGKQVAQAGLNKVYEEIDLPLMPVLARMEDAGVKIDCDVLAEMSQRLDRECKAKAKEIHALAGTEFNISSPKQLGDVLFNQLGLPKPVKYGKGK